MSNRNTHKDENELQEINLNTQYMLTSGGDVINVIDLGYNEKGKREFIRVDSIFTVNKFELFGSKRDAMYHKLIKELNSGKPLSNFKRSQYYSYYVKRLQKEHPEYVI